MRRCIALELVRDKLPRRFALSLQHVAKEPFSSSLVPTFGHQNIQNITVLINRSPQVELLSLNLHGPLRRGSRGSTVTRADRATGETVLVPSRNRWSQVGRISGDPVKSAEDETVPAGSVVVVKRGNARGAKGPCCT